MIRLRPHLPFHPNETPLSWANRLTAFHVGGKVGDFLKDFGLSLRAVHAGQKGELVRLCELTGQAAHPVLRNALSMGWRTRIAFEGEAFEREFLVSSVARFCPHCLLADESERSDRRSGVMRRFRVMWTLRPFRVCPQHQTLLIERDVVRSKPETRTLRSLVPEDAIGLTGLCETTASTPPSALQDYVVDRLAGRRRFPWLDKQSIEQATTTCEHFGGLVLNGPEVRSTDLGPMDWVEAGSVGLEIASQGPRGIEDALHATVARYRPKFPGGKAGPQRFYGMLHRWATFGTRHAKKDRGPILDVMRDTAQRQFCMMPGQRLYGQEIERPHLMTRVSFCNWRGSFPTVIGRILEARAVKPVPLPGDEDAGVRREAFRVDDLDAALAVAQLSVSQIDVGKALGAIPNAITRLLGLGYLETHRQIRSMHSRKLAAIKRLDFEVLAELLSEIPLTDTIPDGFESCNRRAGYLPIPATEVLSLVLAKGVLDVRALGARATISDLLARRSDLKRFSGLEMAGMTARTARRMLMIPPKANLSRISGGAREHPFPTRQVAGQTWVDACTMRTFRERYITFERLVAEHGTDPALMTSTLRKRRISPIHDPDDCGVAIYAKSRLPGFLVL